LDAYLRTCGVSDSSGDVLFMPPKICIPQTRKMYTSCLSTN